MKPLRFIFVFLFLAIASFAREPKPHGQVVQITVHSAALEHNHVADSPDREVSVYLPPGYESSTQRYAVVYLLHGYTATDRGWMDPGYVGLPGMMDHLIERHAIEPMIIVMPNCFNRLPERPRTPRPPGDTDDRAIKVTTLKRGIFPPSDELGRDP